MNRMLCVFLPLIALLSIFANAEDSKRPGVVTNSVGMKLRLIPSGTFTMGSPEQEKDRKPGEILHQVTVGHAFYIGVHEVTQAQYESVTGTNPSERKGPELPVEHVSWHDAVSFCEKLSAREPGWRYRLPTEAEWEYACRAGTTTRFYWGEDLNLTAINEHAFYKGNSAGKTSEVGQKEPNPWGLHDMNGNVWEWCQDWMGPYDTTESTDPVGPPTGEGKVCRGGCWAYDATRCRSAERNDAPADSVHVNLGIRIVAEVVK